MYNVCIGSKTSTGGEVVEGNSDILIDGKAATSVGQKATCKSGRKSCRGIGAIVPVGPRTVNYPAGPGARDGDYVDCGCPPGANVILGKGSAKIG